MRKPVTLYCQLESSSSLRSKSDCRRHLAASTSVKRIALLIETSRSYGRDLLRGIKRFSVEHGGWSLFVEVRDLESAPPAWLQNWDGDGIITRSGSAAIASAVRRVGVPAVELRSQTRSNDLPFVGVDNAAVSETVYQHLRECGLQHFGVFALHTEAFFVERQDSFRQLVQKDGFCLHEFVQAGVTERPSRWERQQQRLMEWLQDLPKPIGILACTDQLGCWLLDACRRAGLRVPDEVAVVGVEDDETLTEMSSPPLSSVRLDGEGAGYRAAEILRQRIRRPNTRPKTVLLPPLKLSRRRSTELVATEDPHLATAIRLLRDQACSGIRVDDVLAHVPLSRTALERGCRRVTGRSPNQEIVHAKIRHACELLEATEMTLDEVAMRCGFSTTPYFAKVFRTLLDVTPGRFRSERSRRLEHGR